MYESAPSSKKEVQHQYSTMAKTLKTRGASVTAARKSARLASRSTATAGPVDLPPSSLSRCSPPPAMRRVAQPSSPGPRSPSSPAAVPLLSLPSVSPPPSPVHCQSSSLKSVPRPAFLLPLPTPKPILPYPVQAAVPSVPFSFRFFSYWFSFSSLDEFLSLNLPLPT